MNYRSGADAARKVVEEIRATGAEAIPLQADVASEQEVQSMFRIFHDAFGHIDILVANPGIQMDAGRKQYDPRTMAARDRCEPDRTVSLRAGGDPLLLGTRGESLFQAVGKIVCMSSVHQVIPWKGHVNHAASKGGVMLMMKSLA